MISTEQTLCLCQTLHWFYHQKDPEERMSVRNVWQDILCYYYPRIDVLILILCLKRRKSTTHTAPSIYPSTLQPFRSNPSIYYYLFVQLSIDLAVSSLLFCCYSYASSSLYCGEHDSKTPTGQFHWFLWWDAPDVGLCVCSGY